MMKRRDMLVSISMGSSVLLAGCISSDDEERCSAMMLMDSLHEIYGGHVWIYYDGKHYDAENPEGVSNWRNLNFMKRKRKQYENNN